MLHHTDFDWGEYSGMDRAVHHTKSFLISMALVKGKLSVEDASVTSHVEVNSQIARWGEVEDSECAFLGTTIGVLTWLTTAHDVDYRDIRRQLGSVSIMLANI